MRVSAGAQVYSRPTGFRKQCSVLPHNPNHLSLVSNQQWLPWHPGLYAHRPAEHRCARSAIVAAPPRTSKEHGAKTKDCGFFLHVFFYLDPVASLLTLITYPLGTLSIERC